MPSPRPRSTPRPAGRTAASPRRARTAASEPRPRDADRSQGEILEAATAEFAEFGLGGARVDRIAERAGVNKRLIYYYFGSKEELFRATIEHAVDRAFQHFRLLRESRTTPPEIIAGWLENHVMLSDLIRKLVKIGLDYAGSDSRVASIDRSIRRFYDDEAAAVSEAIRSGIRQGLFRETDTDRLATFISTHLDGVMVRSMIFPEFDVARAVADLQARVWEHLDYRPAG